MAMRVWQAKVIITLDAEPGWDKERAEVEFQAMLEELRRKCLFPSTSHARKEPAMEAKKPAKCNNQHRGWDIWYHGEHPATGKWRADRHGVQMGAGTFGQLIRMIDQRIEDERLEKF